MKILGWILAVVGFSLLYSWFGVRKRSVATGVWENEKYGAYLWLAIDLALLIGGLVFIAVS